MELTKRDKTLLLEALRTKVHNIREGMEKVNNEEIIRKKTDLLDELARLQVKIKMGR